MSIVRMPFVFGLMAGFLAITALQPVSATNGAEKAIPVQELARLSWPHLTDDQRQMVDLVAKDMFENQLSTEQRIRIGGRPDTRYETLSEWRKTPFRGMALRDLGLGVDQAVLQSV